MQNHVCPLCDRAGHTTLREVDGHFICEPCWKRSKARLAVDVASAKAVAPGSVACAVCRSDLAPANDPDLCPNPRCPQCARGMQLVLPPDGAWWGRVKRDGQWQWEREPVKRPPDEFDR